MCTNFLERFVFPDFCTFRFSNRAHFVLPDSDWSCEGDYNHIMTMKLRNVPFSPPDMTEAEAAEVRDAILSGWITTGPRTKK